MQSRLFTYLHILGFFCADLLNKDEDVEVWKQFGDRVGWRVNDSWIGYRNLTFSLDAPEGHLPEWVFVSGFVGGGFFGSGLFARAEDCEL